MSLLYNNAVKTFDFCINIQKGDNMAKLWAGRTSGEINKTAEEFNSSIGIDKLMYSEDIKGSIAHAKMLSKCGIITEEEGKALTNGLEKLLEELNSGELKIDESSEDIHTFVEQCLTQMIGETGKKLHTARSRNDQVALDTRLYLKKQCDEISELLRENIITLTKRAQEYKSAIMPGYTHLQRAQPIVFGHHLLSYAFMFLRDIGRIADCKKRMNVSPIGSCALAGTTYNTDRVYEAELLGFDGICENSIDGVSDRDFIAELLSCLSILMMHLSRFCEEIILWSSFEFGFIKLDDAYTTGSSIMPQKKNPDMAELIRGKTGRVYGELTAMLTTLKGLPLAYNKDMQEDKAGVFDACETVKICLEVLNGMVLTLKANTDKMRQAAGKGFINATDLADYLVTKGLPFRSAYKLSGEIVNLCSSMDTVLEELHLEEYKKFSPLFESDLYEFISLENCAAKRISRGGTGLGSVEKQIEIIKNQLKI